MCRCGRPKNVKDDLWRPQEESLPQYNGGSDDAYNDAGRAGSGVPVEGREDKETGETGEKGEADEAGNDDHLYSHYSSTRKLPRFRRFTGDGVGRDNDDDDDGGGGGGGGRDH